MTNPPEQGRQFTRWQRFQIRFMQYFGFCLVYIGRTLRWESRGDQYLQEAHGRGKPVILALWHGRIVAGTWYWRHRGIVVMTSLNFDGEYIARFLQMYGYGTARGSSSRGGLRALAEMARCLEQGKDVAFTVDGPHGPRYVAKIGPILLAKKTGCPILCFHVSAERRLQLKNWDHFQVPAPFSRALILKAPLIWVPTDADEETQRAKHREMQEVLDRLRDEGDAYWQDQKSANRRQ